MKLVIKSLSQEHFSLSKAKGNLVKNCLHKNLNKKTLQIEKSRKFKTLEKNLKIKKKSKYLKTKLTDFFRTQRPKESTSGENKMN